MEKKIILSISDFGKMMERAILQYAATGKIPTYEELEEANLLTDLKIEKFTKE